MNPHRSFNVWFVLHWMQWLLAVLSVICVFLPDSQLLRMADTDGWRLILFIVALYTGWSFLAKRLATFVLAIRLQRWVLATPWKEAIKSSAMRCLVGNWQYSHVEKVVFAVANKNIARQRQEVARRKKELHTYEQLMARRNRVLTHAIEHGFSPEAASAFTAQLTGDASDDDRLISRITCAGQILSHAVRLEAQTGSRDAFVRCIVKLLVDSRADTDSVATYVFQMRRLWDWHPNSWEQAAAQFLGESVSEAVDLAPVMRAVEEEVVRDHEHRDRRAQIHLLERRYSALKRPVQITLEPLLIAARAAIDKKPRVFRKALHALEQALNAADSSHASFD